MLSTLTLLLCWAAQDGPMPAILDMRSRAELVDGWLEVRMEEVVPELMRRERIDLWVILSREYNEDPLFPTMAPSTWLRARRRTILVFHDRGVNQPIERLAVSRYDVGSSFTSSWDPGQEPDQWKRLAEVIAERDPKRIAVNSSANFALADGGSHSEQLAFQQALPARFRERIVPGERLAIGWLETRIDEEMAVYPSICRIAHRIIAEGLSERVIQPGVTTTEDVQWWYRDRIRELKLTTWFHPSVSLQRAEDPERSFESFFSKSSHVILPGDLLHVDFGITYLRLNTDTQQHAYVLRPGEDTAPRGLVDALAVGNRLQDILTSQFQSGRSGNEILARARKQAASQGIEARIYTHPLGYHGHGAGPTIGLWDQQDGVPGKGDYPLYPRTVHSIELSAEVPVKEWAGKKVRIMLEEDAYFDGEAVRYLDGRQTELLLIPRG